jgi:hypothetical protein
MKSSVVIWVVLSVGLCSGVRASAQTATNTDRAVPSVIQTNNITYTNEQQLLTALPQLRWTQTYMVRSGWLKPGQGVLPKANTFSKKDFRLFGVSGEIQVLFDQSAFGGERPYSVGFWVEGDEHFATLYRAVKKVLTVPERRSGDAQSGSRIDWDIKGETNQYQVAIVRRVFGNEIERSLEVDVKASR